MAPRQPPPTASIAAPDAGGKLLAPSAERNSSDICALLQKVAPERGDVLEIASGTGQHIAAFATAMPHLHWYPTDVAPDRLASIAAYVADAELQNVAPPQYLDACHADWAADMPNKALIYLVNLLHLISDAESRTLITEAAKALSNNGILMLYGPFKRSGALTSEGDARFDATLRASDSDIGYKDDLDIINMLGDAGLVLVDVHELPANNLAFVARSTR